MLSPGAGIRSWEGVSALLAVAAIAAFSSVATTVSRNPSTASVGSLTEARSLQTSGEPRPPAVPFVDRDTASAKQVPQNQSALIVGINRAAGARPLYEAVRDAEMLERALKRYGFPAGGITVLRDGAATKDRILAEIDDLAAKTPKDGKVVIALAGHTRIRGGTNHFVAGDGRLITARTLASRVGRIKAPTWITLPTCYAGGYARPGIIGKNRIATFASGAGQMAYELSGLGSWLMLHMVQYAMLDARAPDSVEQAFGFARKSIQRETRNRTPLMYDGIKGEFVLGPVSWDPPRDSFARRSVPRIERPPPAAVAPRAPRPEQRPEPTPLPRRLPLRVCTPLTGGCPK